MKDLPAIPFFKDIPRDQFELIAPLFMPFAIPVNTTIFEQGDQAAYLYIIVSGTVSLQYKPYDGPAITLTHLRAGDVFGWSSVVGRKRYTSSVVSITELETIRVRGADLRKFCVDHRDIGCTILERLAEIVSPRWKNAKDQVRDMLQNKLKTKKALA